MPCYNPQPGWAGRIVRNYRDVCRQLNTTVDLVLVNDGSAHGIAQEDIATIQDAITHFTYVSYDTNKGKGYALRKGIEGVNTDIIIYTDVDFPYTTQSLLNIYHTLIDNTADLAVGIKDDEYYTKVPPARKHISRILRKMTGFFLRLPVTDTQCGLKGFQLQAKNTFLQTSIDRYLFDLEFIRSAFRKKMSVKTVQVKLKDDITFSKMNYTVLLPEIFNFMLITMRIK